ncbi:MAG: aquaporin [Acidobacteriia bacterium]|nr:aquaporin [Terriglobia bacterium]
MNSALKQHWPEYLMEAGELGIFMISACLFASILQYPGSPVSSAIADPLLRRLLMGLAMGTTAIALIHSPWGKQSGAHFNPAVTLTFLRLGKMKSWDALFYVIAQFCGGVMGVLVSSALLGHVVMDPQVNHAVTVPGMNGVAEAFVAELIISFGLMTVVLTTSNHQNLSRYTGLFAGGLVATYITFESPISGMSMNPARTLGSAVVAQLWTALWIYFTAPPLGMLSAGEIYLYFKGRSSVLCAKLNHHNNKRCIFRCGYMQKQESDVSI